MSDKTLNNKRIAKNTIFLYFRMIFIMVVSLFTSRVVLNTLGVEDYGIYNVVGGIVAMFGFLNASMSSSTQRYIAYALGKNDYGNLRKIFSTCFLTHLLIAFVVLVLIETAGIWLLYNKMVIPTDRMNAAFWVFQFSSISAVVAIIGVPFNSDIIAHEKMSAFAYISILEVVLKLVIVYMLSIGNIDKLILYAALILVVQISIVFFYQIYCLKHFEESRIKFIWDGSLFKEIFGFAGWNMWGCLAHILYTQGLNILLNMFFGPAVNAARGVATQVQGAVQQFSSNFQMALNPQITKTYAANDMKSMHTLIYRSSKFTFFLLFALSLPVIMETEQILTLWLKIVPDWTVIFVRLMLCVVMVDSIANPLMTAAAATGRVKVYQSVVGGILLLIVPISYIVLKLGGNPYSVFIVHFAVCTTAFAVRLFIIRPMINFSISSYLKNAIARCIVVGIVSLIIPVTLRILLDQSIFNSFVIIIASVISVLVFTFLIGLTTNERLFIANKIKEVAYKII